MQAARAAAAGSGGGGAGGPGGRGPQAASNGGGGGSGNNSGAAPPSPPAPPGAEGQASGGHPVDVVTGAMFTIPSVDFELFGPSAVQWVRQYRSSAVERNCGLGWGWSHTYAWRAEVTANGINVIDSEGAVISFPRLEDGEVAFAPFGRKLWRRGNDLVLSQDDDSEHVLRRDATGVHRLVEVRDRAGNIIDIEWDNGEVCAVVDSVGRRAERERQLDHERWYLVLIGENGSTHRLRAVSYVYDQRGDLVQVIDVGGASFEYRYDRLPGGLVFHFRYEDGPDGKRRCVETWGEIPGRDILAELGGGQRYSPLETKGIYHTRFRYGPEPFETTMIDAEGGRPPLRGQRARAGAEVHGSDGALPAPRLRSDGADRQHPGRARQPHPHDVRRRRTADELQR
ncbi:DUF6531 domain-containing protein [Sorangium sp. So ce321]|uniref:DUF6531 domain-containing protein n=1 Tax=Sorangium sp. So ce321 TaxID=3133300 RepID=UPI003F5E2AD9